MSPRRKVSGGGDTLVGVVGSFGRSADGGEISR